VIGLTGAVGAGKTTAAAAFAALGCAVIDVDRLGHDALDDPAVRSAVARRFGASVLGPDGRIDRRALGAIAFGKEGGTALASLEGLVHPWVLAQLDERLAAARRSGPRAVVVDCALLFEGGLDRRCDVTVVVETDERTRERRVAAGRGWSAGEFERRQAAQLSAAEKRSRADRTLSNDGSADDLRERAASLLDELAPVQTARPARPGRTRAAAGRPHAARRAGDVGAGGVGAGA
jgi:dephospho-CoA kinase